MGYVQTVDDRISINLLSASLKITFRPAWRVEISSLYKTLHFPKSIRLALFGYKEQLEHLITLLWLYIHRGTKRVFKTLACQLSQSVLANCQGHTSRI